MNLALRHGLTLPLIAGLNTCGFVFTTARGLVPPGGIPITSVALGWLVVVHYVAEAATMEAGRTLEVRPSVKLVALGCAGRGVVVAAVG